jgi:hypothetical protein
MGWFKDLFGYKKVEVVLSDAYVEALPLDSEEEFFEEPEVIRVKPRKPKKLNKGLTKKVISTKKKKEKK